MTIEPKNTREHILSLYGHVTGLKKDIFILKDNHIRHMHEDIDKIDKKVDTVADDQKNLLYWIIGATLTTILTLAGLFNIFLK